MQIFYKIILSTLSDPPLLGLIHFFKINNIHIKEIFYPQGMLKKLDGVAPLAADWANANSTADTDTHLLSDIGDTVSTSSIWLYRQNLRRSGLNWDWINQLIDNEGVCGEASESFNDRGKWWGPAYSLRACQIVYSEKICCNLT